MSDRAIVPGASKEFSAFVGSANDAPQLVQDNPDAGLGILQAAFIGGYSIAIILSGHYVHKIRWKRLVLSGLCVWWLGVLGSGNAKQYNSFYVLLFSRMASGCSEAAFHVVAPPLIQDRAGKYAGLWLSIYLTGVPLGLAWGYIYGSYMAGHDMWGWDWAYYFEAIASVPLLITMVFVKDETNGGILSGAGEHNINREVEQRVDDNGGDTLQATDEPLLASSSNDENGNNHNSIQQQPKRKKFTIFSEIKTCFSSPVLVSLSLGFAAMMAVVASLGTFGGAFVLALQLFDDERVAATCFGVAAALAGVIGTPLGGRMVDLLLIHYSSGDSSAGGVENVDESMRNEIVTNLMPRINILVGVALLFVFPTLAMQEAVYFLTFLFIGWTLLFATQTGITVCAMFAVDRGHRPNALAFLTLASHVFGDVPAPILLGLIKDKLAPACKIGQDGEFVDPEGCIAQEAGVRQSLAIAYSWTLWCLVFFEIARRYAFKEKTAEDKRRVATEREEQFNGLLLRESNDETNGGEGIFQYYHSKFHPSQDKR